MKKILKNVFPQMEVFTVNEIFLYFSLYFILTDILLELIRNTAYSISFESERDALSPWLENQESIIIFSHHFSLIFEKVLCIT